MKSSIDSIQKSKKLKNQEKEERATWKSMSMFLVPLLLSNILQSVGQLFGMVVISHCNYRYSSI